MRQKRADERASQQKATLKSCNVDKDVHKYCAKKIPTVQNTGKSGQIAAKLKNITWARVEASRKTGTPTTGL